VLPTTAAPEPQAVQFELQPPQQRAAGDAGWWEAVKGLQNHKMERLAVQQDSVVRMLGLRSGVRMHMDVTVDHGRRQVRTRASLSLATLCRHPAPHLPARRSSLTSPSATA
jgi:hypothetical protein